MDERAFVERRRPEWERLAAILDRASSARGLKALTSDELLDLGKLYRRLTSDLSYVKANSTNEDLIVYLNDLAGRAHGYVYADARDNTARTIVRFLQKGFPVLCRESASYIWMSTAIFLLAAVFASVVVIVSPDSYPSLVPPMFRDAGPESGVSGPGDAGIPNPATFSTGLMANNIYVSIRAFAGGITFGVWTVYELIRNGLMLGALGARFSQTASGALEFWSLILPHGFIELTAIVVAGGAGLMLGWSLIAPGNLRRWDSLRSASRRAAPLMGGVAAMLVAAGMIEGFITPAPLSPWVKLTFSALTAVGLGVYFSGGPVTAHAKPLPTLDSEL